MEDSYENDNKAEVRSFWVWGGGDMTDGSGSQPCWILILRLTTTPTPYFTE